MKMLMHMCCGPCSCYPLKKLRTDGIEPTGYFFNPNIHPYQEWNERLQTARKFAEIMQMDFVADETYAMRDFLKKAEHFADFYGISFYYEDFRIGWQDGINLSKELGLYRQSYCGCVFSEEERYSRALRKLQRKENKERKRLRLMA